MTSVFAKHFRRFRDSDEGSMVVPFALWTPVFLGLILSSIELGTVTIRHTALERAMDETVRDLRLGTGGAVDHATLKTQICERAAVLPGCSETLHLEMLRLDMRAWETPPLQADCVDVSESLNPQRNFSFGNANEMMMLRACYKYRPVTPAGTLSSSLPQDDEGYTALVATTAFVHEPM